MTETKTTEQFTFQAEIKELLRLLSHSLYQNREITLRELISNASDAIDKYRHQQLTAGGTIGDDLAISLSADETQKTLTIADNGVGMTRQELIDNLGTIARSGSREFVARMADSQAAGMSLIGQFGVGFYSAFMLADTVEVLTRSRSEEQGWRWTSDGAGEFAIEPADELPVGTQVRLHLKSDASEFTRAERLKHIVRTYSAFVSYPIRLEGEQLNTQRPIWVEPKAQLSDEQYHAFFQYLTHGVDETPRWKLHLSSDSPFEFHAILFAPQSNFEKLGFGKYEHGLHLCAKRILVQNDNRELLPEFLRFLTGLVDSADLPLNVSRESLQDNTVFRKIRKVLVKKILDDFESIRTDEPARYRAFYAEFGPILREGVANYEYRDALKPLLLFPTDRTGAGGGVTSLAEYVARMPASQDQIYYVCGHSRESLARNPNLEIFRKRGLEVLLLTDPVDEIALSQLDTFDGKKIVSVDASDLKIPEGEEQSDQETNPESAPPAGFESLLSLFREAIGDRVAEVRASRRLTDSPCCLVTADGRMSMQLQKLLRMQHEDFPMSEQILEINPDAPLIRRLSLLTVNPDNAAFLRECGLNLLDQALLTLGIAPDGEGLAQRMMSMMQQLADGKTAIIV